MKKAASGLLCVMLFTLVGCNATVDVNMPSIEDIQTNTEWKLDPETGSWEQTESTTYVTIKEKEFDLPETLSKNKS